MYNIRIVLYHDNTPVRKLFMINMFDDPPVGFGLIFKVEDLFDLCYENVLIIFKRLSSCVDLGHVVSKDKTFDFMSFVSSVEPLNSKQHNFKQQILKLEDFLKLTIIHFSVRARRANAAVLSYAMFIAAVHDIPHTVNNARVY
nr:hypothetical protein [Tanacetum cinerariifolium]